MSVPLIDHRVLQCFVEFITLYIECAPDPEDLKKYIKSISNEKEIVRSLENGLITQDEFSNFWLSHIYTKYVLNQDSISEVNDDEIERIRKQIATLLFG